jgi:hypothetical protein
MHNRKLILSKEDRQAIQALLTLILDVSARAKRGISFSKYEPIGLTKRSLDVTSCHKTELDAYNVETVPPCHGIVTWRSIHGSSESNICQADSDA